MPAIGLSNWLVPAISAMVGKKSQAKTGIEEIDPSLTTRGQLMTGGTRIPPSHNINFLPRRSGSPGGGGPSGAGAQRMGREKHSARQAAYGLAKLRGKKLVQRRNKSWRYESDPGGVRTMCVCLVLREKAIKQRLAGASRPLGRPPKVIAPLVQHYLKRQEEMNRTFDPLGLAK